MATTWFPRYRKWYLTWMIMFVWPDCQFTLCLDIGWWLMDVVSWLLWKMIVVDQRWQRTVERCCECKACGSLCHDSCLQDGYEDNFSRGIPSVHVECKSRYLHNRVFLTLMFYKRNCNNDENPEGRKGRSCYFITRGPLMSIAPAGGPPWYYSMWSHHRWWGFVKHQTFVMFLFQSRLGPFLWIACLLAIAKQWDLSRNPLAASAIP